MNIIKTLIILLGISIIASCSSHNQTVNKNSNFPKLNIADEVIIHSEILNKDREIYIYHPGSQESDTEYPVLYLMDGDLLTPVIASQIHTLSMLYQLLPPMIIVGINNYTHDRDHDLTPTNCITDMDGEINYDQKSSGGGGEFLEFIEKELIPYIDSNYKTKPYKILSGHSLGGLMSLHCYVHKDIFDAYIAISPALWWDNNYLVKEIDKRYESSEINDKKIFMSISNEIDNFPQPVIKLDSIFTQNISKIGSYKFNRYPDEVHGSGWIKAIYDGLKFIYTDEWDKAVSESLNMTNYYSSRGYSNLESGDSLFIESSIGDFTKVIESKPNDAYAYAQRALAKARINRHKQALIDFNKAEELGINFPVFYFNRGYSYLSIENYKEAVSDFKKFDELMPNNLYIFLMLGSSYRGLNNFKMSTEYYNKYLKLNQDGNEDSLKEVREAIIEMGFTPEY